MNAMPAARPARSPEPAARAGPGLARSAPPRPGRAQGDDGRTRADPARPLDARRLRAGFQDLLGRPPTLAERAEWSGRGLHELLDAHLGGEEAWRHWFEEQLYYFLLVDNFEPGSERVRAIPADLARGALDVRQALHRVAISPAFDRRNPGPDTFVSVVLEQLCGITVQKQPGELEIGKHVYDGGEGRFLGKLASSQADLVRVAVEDPAFARTLVAREHLRLLRAEPERKDLAAWSRAVHRDPAEFPGILRGWYLSEAWEQRLDLRVSPPNRLFVRSLFVDLVDRLPSEEETRRMRGALDGLSDPGPLRSVLARLLIDSGQAPVPAREDIEDPTAWIAGLFERLLGREASPEELRAFAVAFRDPACRPETVLVALCSHPEYQRF